MDKERFTSADFSPEELLFAQELLSLFNLEQEELPPDYIQALSKEPDRMAAPEALEQRVATEVFRRLNLTQHLEVAAKHRQRHSQAQRAQSYALTISRLIALLLVSLLIAAPSFSRTFSTLFDQTKPHQETPDPPRYPVSLMENDTVTLREAQAEVPFPIDWLGETAFGYSYQALWLHPGQPWSNGPVIELHYSQSDATAVAGQVVVREFSPAPGANILEVVAPGAARSVQFDARSAFYIDGRWIRQRGQLLWEQGKEAALVYQAAGVIFWITIYQQNGASPAVLEALARSLEYLHLKTPRLPMPEDSTPLWGLMSQTLAQPALGEVLTLLPVSNSLATGAAVFLALGTPPNDS